jgi:ribosome-binding ATPase YchF (GTP1/OBG family)
LYSDWNSNYIASDLDAVIQYGSEAAVKEAGKMGIEGKEYVVQDGDIMHFRFNV